MNLPRFGGASSLRHHPDQVASKLVMVLSTATKKSPCQRWRTCPARETGRGFLLAPLPRHPPARLSSLIKPDFILRRSVRQGDFPIIPRATTAEQENADMVIVSLRLAVLTTAMFLVAAPAALADHSSKTHKHHRHHALANMSAPVWSNAPDGRDFLSSAPESYWNQVRPTP